MGLIKNTLAHFFKKYQNILNISLKKEFGIKRIRGAWVICESWFTGSQTIGEPYILVQIFMVHINLVQKLFLNFLI
jgi:hypothetical protein